MKITQFLLLASTVAAEDWPSAMPAMKSNDDDERRMTIEVDMEEQGGEQTVRIRVKDAIKVTASAVAATSLAMLAM